jgi:DNA-binding response OmpR family regulator
MSWHIHIVHREDDMRDTLRDALLRESYVVTDGPGREEVATEALRTLLPDVVLVDLGDVLDNRLALCATLKGSSDAALLALCHGGERQVVAALRAGADACITAPFSTAELVARVAALLRRPPSRGRPALRPPAMADVDTVGSLRLDRRARTVHLGGAELRLGRKEFDLLSVLLAQLGRVVSREQLIDAVWGSNFEGVTKTLDVHVHQLRSKLSAAGDTPVRIATVTRIGYRLDRLDSVRG